MASRIGLCTTYFRLLPEISQLFPGLYLATLQISWKSTHHFLSYPANRQRDKQWWIYVYTDPAKSGLCNYRGQMTETLMTQYGPRAKACRGKLAYSKDVKPAVDSGCGSGDGRLPMPLPHLGTHYPTVSRTLISLCKPSNAISRPSFFPHTILAHSARLTFLTKTRYINPR